MADPNPSLFYGTHLTPPAKPDATPSPLDELAKKFYPDTPAPAAPPDPQQRFDGADSGQWFDRYAAFRSDFDKHAESLHDTLGVSRQDREADDRSFVKVADDLGMDDQTMLTLHAHIVQGLTQAVEADADDARAGVHARDVTVRRTLREQLGEHTADDLIARTERYIADHPELEELVNRGALATKPEPFLLLAEHVQAKHIR